MTKQNASEYLPLMTALAEGKTLQFRLHSAAPWGDCVNPTFNRPASCYRVKPEPRKVYAVLVPASAACSEHFCKEIFWELDHAEDYAKRTAGKIITFVEQE